MFNPTPQTRATTFKPTHQLRFQTRAGVAAGKEQVRVQYVMLHEGRGFLDWEWQYGYNPSWYFTRGAWSRGSPDPQFSAASWVDATEVR